MADVVPFERRDVSAADKRRVGWRLVTVEADDCGFRIAAWSGRSADADMIRALLGFRRTWAEAMAYAHDRARELGVNEVCDFSSTAVPSDDPEPAA